MIGFAEKTNAIFEPIPIHQNNFSFINASYSRQTPCQLNDAQGLAMDAGSMVITTGHGQLLEAIAEGSKGQTQALLGKLGQRIGYLNVILSWAKLVAALMTVKGEMKIADPMPLERVKGNEGGQTRLMTVKVWAEIGNKAYVNCVRTAVNFATGLDFSMPNEGPLKDRDISWELTGAASFFGQGSSKTGKFDRFVTMKSPDSNANADPAKQITDDNGESKMNLVGGTRNATLINKPVVPVRKKAGVMASVSFKSSRDVAQNWLDIGGATLGVYGNPITGVLGSLPEIGFRTKWTIGSLTVPVKDWELCTSDWAGTVEYKRVFKTSFPVKTATRKGTQTIDEKTEITWNLNPRKRDMPADTPPIPDDVSVIVDNSSIFDGTGEADVCCNKKEAKDAGARIREAITLKIDNDTKSLLKINLSNNFLLSIYPSITDANAFMGTRRRSFTVSESECPVDEDQTAESSNDVIEQQFLEALHGTKTNRVLSNHGESVEEISGTETFDDPRGGEITYKWDLARCGD